MVHHTISPKTDQGSDFQTELLHYFMKPDIPDLIKWFENIHTLGLYCTEDLSLTGDDRFAFLKFKELIDILKKEASC